MIYRKAAEIEPVPGVAPCIVARLAEGWQFVSARRGFRQLKSGKSLRVRGLPPSTRVELRYSDLAGIAPEDMSNDDKELARYVQFVFHPRARLGTHLARISSWAAIESAYVVPVPVLPGQAAPADTSGGPR